MLGKAKAVSLQKVDEILLAWCFSENGKLMNFTSVWSNSSYSFLLQHTMV